VNLLRAAATISSLTLLSRWTGLVRDLLISRIFGVSAATDAFNVAFRIPNLLRRLFAEGAFQQAFVSGPRGHAHAPRRRGMRHLVDHVAAALFWTLLLVSLLGVVAAPLLVWAIADRPGARGRDLRARDDDDALDVPVHPLHVAGGVCGRRSQQFKRFAVPAVTPVLLNLSFIACALWLAPKMADADFSLALAVIIGACCSWACRLPALYRLGMLPRSAIR